MVKQIGLELSESDWNEVLRSLVAFKGSQVDKGYIQCLEGLYECIVNQLPHIQK